MRVVVSSRSASRLADIRDVCVFVCHIIVPLLLVLFYIMIENPFSRFVVIQIYRAIFVPNFIFFKFNSLVNFMVSNGQNVSSVGDSFD